MILHLLHIFLTDALTFILISFVPQKLINTGLPPPLTSDAAGAAHYFDR
jgi:hypothetical protein